MPSILLILPQKETFFLASTNDVLSSSALRLACFSLTISSQGTAIVDAESSSSVRVADCCCWA